MIRKVLLLLGQILNPKTLYFNFKYLPLNQAIKLPVFITYKTRLLKTSGNVKIDEPIKTGMIRIGYGQVGIFDKRHTRAMWEVRGNVHFKGRALLKFGSKISVGKDGNLEIGKNFRISPESSVVCCHRVSIGDHVRISWQSIILDTDFHKIMTLDGKRINYPKEIRIGNRVWIGMRASLLKGTGIQDNNVVASNSVINKPIRGSNCIIGGHPARIISEKVKWEP